MKKSGKIAMIAASGMVFAGIVISLCAMCAMGFDFSKMETATFRTETHPVEQSFSRICVEGAGSDVRLYLSDDDSCRVQCHEREGLESIIEIKDDTLYIRQQDNRTWKQYIGIFVEHDEIGIYLPESSYQSITASLHSGDLMVSEEFRFQEADIQSTSGRIELHASVEGDLFLRSDSGNITLAGSGLHGLTARSNSGKITMEHVTARADIRLETSSGNLRISDVQGQNLSAEVNSGSMDFQNVLAETDMQLKSTSGSIRLQRSEGYTMHIQTGSGNVSGTLCTEKQFVTNTGSSSCSVPDSGSGGICEITTGSGDIHLELDK